MRLLDRYLLRELLVPLTVCLGGFFIFWVAFDLFSELDDFQEAGVGPGSVAYYYLLVSPSFLKIVLPTGLLLAMLVAALMLPHSGVCHLRCPWLSACSAKVASALSCLRTLASRQLHCRGLRLWYCHSPGALAPPCLRTFS